MIKEYKNISGQSLDWGNGVIQSVGESMAVDVWLNEHYGKLCEFTSLDMVEAVAYDDLIISGATAREWALKKIRKIEIHGHYPLIYDLVDPFFEGMPFHSIDYKRNLLSGVKLHPKHIFTTDGLLGCTKYYNGFESEQNPGQLVLDVCSVWTTDENETIPAAADVIQREKVREWVDTNGELNTKSKKSTKKYDTLKKVQNEGKRRRDNLKELTIDKLGMCLVLMGEANNAVEAQDIMLQFHHDYNVEFADYREAGKGDLYDKITNDLEDVESSNSWMKTTVVDNATNQAMIPEAIGKKIGEFTRDKLKGLI